MIEYDDERPVLEASIISLPRTKQLETAGSGLQALEATVSCTCFKASKAATRK